MTEDQQRQQVKERKSIHEIRNQDLVSRLLAATPPYLYSAPVGPNNFFFSDMLRSLVQARNNENARNIQIQQAAISRRPRKRSWSQHRPYYEHLKERKDIEEKMAEKPLELTNKQLFPISSKYSKQEPKDDSTKISHTTLGETKLGTEFDQNVASESQNTIQDPPAASLPPSELVLPPPPPVWYPPIYPPYGIDPLHFFIDLRVSGHIYDRKKENVSPLTNSDNNNIPNSEAENFGKQRHGSAFTIPAPRNESKTSSAINLSSSNGGGTGEKVDDYSKYYDMSGDSKENQPNSKNTNYVLQNLPRIYTQFTSRDSDENSFENDNKSDQDLEELTEEQGKENSGHIDVEEVDTVKSRNDMSRCRSPRDQTEIHQID